MGLFVIKNPVEYGFHQWISAHPDSRHWADKERFYRFVKTVCRYNAKRWKDTKYRNTDEERPNNNKRSSDKTPHKNHYVTYKNKQ